MVAEGPPLELPFDSVLLRTSLERRCSVEEFLALPIHERVACILQGRVEFFLGTAKVDRKLALASLRVAAAAAAGAR